MLVCVCVVFTVSKEFKGEEEEHTEFYSGSPNVDWSTPHNLVRVSTMMLEITSQLLHRTTLFPWNNYNLYSLSLSWLTTLFAKSHKTLQLSTQPTL